MSERKGTRALELWCKRLIRNCPEVQIENMTTSWRNGMAFCALVHHFRPDLIDMTKLNPNNIYENNQLAFSVAEEHLGIPSLLDPEDMVENETPDRLSILTYLSQFYQRLGHTVNTKASDSDITSPVPSQSSSLQSNVAMFGKADLDKCVACGLPVYLAQKLIVAHKLYHRRCFRCTKCLGHLNPNTYNVTTSECICDSCKNYEKLNKPMISSEAQMGMLAFNDTNDVDNAAHLTKPVTEKENKRPLSISEKINMFEHYKGREELDSTLRNLSLKNSNNTGSTESDTVKVEPEDKTTNKYYKDEQQIDKDDTKTVDVEEVHIDENKALPEPTYKSDTKKNSFLQTQLSDEKCDEKNNHCNNRVNNDITTNVSSVFDSISDLNPATDANITDDVRLESTVHDNPFDQTDDIEVATNPTKKEVTINIPPRRKKRSNITIDPTESLRNGKEKTNNSLTKIQEYPDHLNPFSDEEDDDQVETSTPQKKRISTNPFGSSDEEDEDDVTNTPASSIATNITGPSETPQRRHIVASNPFWSDGEEPTTDDESHDQSSPYNSSMATSTPNLRHITPRRKKGRAPPPPPTAACDVTATSNDDVASLSSMSSYCSTVHSDKHGKLTPHLQKKHLAAPTPPDSISTVSECSRDAGNTMGSMHDISGACRKKRPAPGLPLPARRSVRAALPPGELQTQLDLLETQQLGLERQGVLIEQMIRDKCEREDAEEVPQEEVEELVIQLCELVNEKNDLFRKQTELMYIRRQQRLEQEQADIEHEIRIIQSQPAVNRIDADKAREEALVSRLVEVVRLRDELVQQLDAERRRERREDSAIAASIAQKRAQRSSGSNSSTMKSEAQVSTTPKKNKVKDKMKKQFKKAKNSLIPKKKDDSENKTDKEKKSKQ